MNRSAAVSRLQSLSVARRGAPAWATRAALCAGLGVACGGFGLRADGQTAPAQRAGARVRPEFRTAARRLVNGAIDRGRVARVPGGIAPQAATAEDLGRRDPAATMESMQLLLRRTDERQAAFDAEVEALHSRGGASFHQWLTPETVGAEFGPADEDIAALKSYLESEGFTVNEVGTGGTYIDFTGTVAQVEQSFHTEIHDLRLGADAGVHRGEQHYSAVREAQIPEALTGLVAGFVSLGDVPAVHTNYRRSVAARAQTSGLNGSPLDTEGGNYVVGPQDFYTIYNENQLLTQATPINGTGATIALLEESAINTADVTAFRNAFGVLPNTPASLTMNTATGGCTVPPVLQSDGEEGEAILDVEWAGAVAPGAKLIFEQCASSRTTGGIFLAAEGAISDNKADILSLSYGDWEGQSSTQDALVKDLWEQAASQGQTVVVSSGDTGPATEDGDLRATVASNGITSSSFSTTAWNVSAGGTDFMDRYNQDQGDSGFKISTFWNGNMRPLGSALSYVPEMTWNGSCASSILNADQKGVGADGAALCSTTTTPYMVAGGGGPSKLYARPSWQTGTVFGLPTTASAPNRLQPDVSLFASNGIWSHDLPSYQSDAGGVQYAGGTSFVAPQLAGVFALLVQKTGERLGQPDYVLYNLAGSEFGIGSYTGGGCNGSGASGVGTTSSLPGSGCVFYDVQTGNISVDCVVGTANCYSLSGANYGILSTSTSVEQAAYPTGQGWDMATGLGSLNIANLVNHWQDASAGGALFTPTVSVTATAASYTYGLPLAISYTATVSGPGSYPTGSVTFSGTGGISTIGSQALTGSAGCATGSTCTESAAQAYTPPGTLAAGSYTITGTYLSTNENYATGAGTTALTVTQQTPVVAVSAASTGVGVAVNLSATIAYSGTGVAPTGGLTFRVDAGATVSATCTGSVSPLTCTYSGYSTTGLATGSHTITAIALADTNYATATGTGTLTVKPLPAIVFTVANHHTQDGAFTVSASSNSAGAFTYSVVSGPATIAGNTVTLTGAGGTVVLQAAQAANGGFAAGTQNASFSVVAGSVWLGNSTGSLSTIDLTGAAITSSGYTGGGVGTIASALGLAFDASGNIWVASSTGVSEFTRQGVAVSSTSITGAGINAPLAIAVDGLGQVWVVNTTGTLSVLSNAGAAISPSTGYAGAGSKPAGVAIDIAGSVWIPRSTANTVTRVIGVAAPVAPLATGAGSSPGVEP